MSLTMQNYTSIVQGEKIEQIYLLIKLLRLLRLLLRSSMNLTSHQFMENWEEGDYKKWFCTRVRLKSIASERP